MKKHLAALAVLIFTFGTGFNASATENISVAEVTGPEKVKISGQVVDEAGIPVIGIAVISSDGTIGTITTETGHFYLTVPAGDVLTVTGIGYQDAKVSTEGQTEFRIVLKTDTQLEEAVLVDVTVVVDVTLQRKVANALAGKVATADDLAVFAVDGVAVLVGSDVCIIGVLGRDRLPVDTAQLEGTAANHGTGFLCPVVTLGNDIVTQRCQSQAGQIQEELIIVDLALELDLQQLFLGGVDRYVVNGGVAFLGGTGIFDIKQEGSSFVISIDLQKTLPSKNDIVGGDTGTVRPEGIVEAEVHLVFAGAFVFLGPIILDKGFLYLAVFVQCEQGVKHKAHDLCQRLVFISLGRVEVVDIVCQIRGDVLPLVILVFLGTAHKGGQQGGNAKKQC